MWKQAGDERSKSQAAEDQKVSSVHWRACDSERRDSARSEDREDGRERRGGEARQREEKRRAGRRQRRMPRQPPPQLEWSNSLGVRRSCSSFVRVAQDETDAEEQRQRGHSDCAMTRAHQRRSWTSMRMIRWVEPFSCSSGPRKSGITLDLPPACPPWRSSSSLLRRRLQPAQTGGEDGSVQCNCTLPPSCTLTGIVTSPR